MEYLESRGIIHRDLAARNVLGEKTLPRNILMAIVNDVVMFAE